MIKLFYIPGACSFGPHMALRESSIPFELEKVYFADAETGKRLAVLDRAARVRGYRALYGDGLFYRDIAPKGLVPALVTEGGDVLTEGAAIYEYIGDTAPDRLLIPPPQDEQRLLYHSWVGEISSTLHKGVHIVAHYQLNEPLRGIWRDRMIALLDRAADALRSKQYLLGDFTLVDLYLFMNWHVAADVVLGGFDRWKDIGRYFDAITSRESVRKAIAVEGTAARYLRSVGGPE